MNAFEFDLLYHKIVDLRSRGHSGGTGSTANKSISFEVTIIWWTEGGLTQKWRCMSVSASGRPNMFE
ncbi:hypothetical protein [Bradyrhizobium sp. CCBAU 53415]|uniref:hypothetical protein n=1 Tax=Bradyrhizobium sp. CCBAU 53415 TaxID=1325119 RepID=UPI00230659B8|nr:hypothetical protein [Bradyrhizobium sp. CCBAU 53415]